MPRISSRSVFSNVGRLALAALLAGAVIGLAGCASNHPMIKSGQACISCHGDDRAAVANLVHKMNGCAGHFYAFLQSCLMYLQAVKSLAAKAGDQAGMYIQDAVGIGFDDVAAQNGQKACQYDYIDMMLF